MPNVLLRDRKVDKDHSMTPEREPKGSSKLAGSQGKLAMAKARLL